MFYLLLDEPPVSARRQWGGKGGSTIIKKLHAADLSGTVESNVSNTSDTSLTEESSPGIYNRQEYSLLETMTFVYFRKLALITLFGEKRLH